jgi:hypothetical protein
MDTLSLSKVVAVDAFAAITLKLLGDGRTTNVLGLVSTLGASVAAQDALQSVVLYLALLVVVLAPALAAVLTNTTKLMLPDTLGATLDTVAENLPAAKVELI